MLAAEAERIVRALAERGATLVVAFGSFGWGDVDPWSGLDILAVMESDLPFVERLAELYEELAPRVGLDLLVSTPEEFERMKGRAFIQHALEEGRGPPCGLTHGTRGAAGWSSCVSEPGCTIPRSRLCDLGWEGSTCTTSRPGTERAPGRATG